MLYIVATPIGNLGDITVRALEVLRSVDVIACEDTRHSQRLLRHYDIKKPLVSYYEHNKITKGQYLLELLTDGKDVALISDSGTPAISDPGFHIVRLAIEHGVSVTPLPGACALIAALSVCGIPADRFIFEGFLPRKKGQQRKRLTVLSQLKKTIVLYESPHRFTQLLLGIKDVFGDSEITVVREISKKFEEIKKAAITTMISFYEKNKIRGEIVVIINIKLAKKNLNE